MSKAKKKDAKTLSGKEFSRKYGMAAKAVDEALDHVFDQIFSDWDRDDESTYAFLCGANNALAYIVGALIGELQRRSVDMDVVLQNTSELSHEGFHTNFLKTLSDVQAVHEIYDFMQIVDEDEFTIDLKRIITMAKRIYITEVPLPEAVFKLFHTVFDEEDEEEE